MSTATIPARLAQPGRHAIPQQAFGPAPITRVEVVGQRTTIHFRWQTLELSVIFPSEATLVLVDLEPSLVSS